MQYTYHTCAHEMFSKSNPLRLPELITDQRMQTDLTENHIITLSELVAHM